MHYNFKTKDTCATQIEFDLEDGIVRNVKFTGGCNGNLKAIPILIDGMSASEVIEKLSEVKCGRRPTSCTAQLTVALKQALDDAI